MHFYALKHMAISDVNMVAACAPVFTVFMGSICLKEKATKMDFVNLVLSLIGCFLIVKPPFIFGSNENYTEDPEYIYAVLAVLIGSLFQGSVYIFLRMLKGNITCNSDKTYLFIDHCDLQMFRMKQFC